MFLFYYYLYHYNFSYCIPNDFRPSPSTVWRTTTAPAWQRASTLTCTSASIVACARSPRTPRGLWRVKNSSQKWIWWIRFFFTNVIMSKIFFSLPHVFNSISFESESIIIFQDTVPMSRFHFGFIFLKKIVWDVWSFESFGFQLVSSWYKRQSPAFGGSVLCVVLSACSFATRYQSLTDDSGGWGISRLAPMQENLRRSLGRGWIWTDPLMRVSPSRGKG